MPFAPASAPVRPTIPLSRELAVAGDTLELLPIPAVLIDRLGTGWHFDAANVPFREAGLGNDIAGSPLIAALLPRLETMPARASWREVFGWRHGAAPEGRHYDVTIARLRWADHPRFLITLVDVTAAVRNEHSLRREMATDSLTGLPNRASFSDSIEAAIGGARDGFAVITIDLDRFARVNACLGSLTGDELLITVARRLKGALRGGDVLARTGGDEFGILLRLNDGPSDAEQVARRIRGAFAAPFRMSDYEVRIGCSLGIAFGSDAIDDAEELIRHAQFAVKRSKSSGRAETYHEQALDSLRDRFAMETALRRAIEGGQLRLTFQPIRDLATGRLWAFESLARWTDENGVERSPADFIAVAEESGLIVPLGRWALAAAARQLADWDARAGGHCGVRMSVNLSAIQLQRDDVAPLVADALADTGLAGERIKLELTESALIADPDRTAATLAELKELGATLAMDDFGTGYSNLAFLQRLPIDILKIDRSFVTGMLADRDKVAIVRAILSLSQTLGLKTVAEGIESAELGQTLAGLGCHYGQGYAYGRPLEVDDAWALIAAERA